jgi:cysteine desulfurase / selenocysteine lyase
MIYLDNAATSFPKPKEVIEAVVRQMEQVGGTAGRSSHQGGLASSRILYETRREICRLINCPDPLRIVFTPNATEALNLVIHGILRRGDHAVTTSMEHNSVLRPLTNLQQDDRSHTIVWGDLAGQIDSAQIEDAIQPNTRLLIMNHCSNVTGTLLPIEDGAAIAKKHGLLFLLDASQSCGSLPIDLEALQADFLAAPGHKALLGPQGTGFLYIRKGLELKTLKQGGTGSRSEDLEEPLTSPDRYESGTQNIHGLAGLRAGLQFILNHGVEAIHEHEMKCAARLMEGLSVIPNIILYGPGQHSKRGSVVSFRVKEMDVSQFNYTLDTLYGISARSGLHCAPLAHKTIGSFPEGTIRLSPGFFTTASEIDETLKAVNELVKQFT